MCDDKAWVIAQRFKANKGLEAVIDDEQDKPMLALIAVQLYELSEKALKKSGYSVLPDTTPDTIN